MSQSFFKPWVGPDYGSSNLRLLVIGISHYGAPGSAYPEFTRDVVQAWLDRASNPALTYFTKLATALTGKPGPEIDREKVFAPIAFMNFCQSLVAETSRMNPSDEQWEVGRHAFWEAQRELRPSHILATGKSSLWEQLPPFTREFSLAGFGPTEIGIYSVDGEDSVATYIKHPSGRGFSGTAEHQRIAPFLRLRAPFVG